MRCEENARAAAVVPVLALAHVLLPIDAGASPADVRDVFTSADTAVAAAIAISRVTFDDAEEVLIARSDVFADSPASGGVQGRSTRGFRSDAWAPGSAMAAFAARTRQNDESGAARRLRTLDQ